MGRGVKNTSKFMQLKNFSMISIEGAEDWVRRSFLSVEFKEKYLELLSQRYSMLLKEFN